MPLYEYRCSCCGKDFDRIVKAGTPEESISCPACGESKSKRKLSLFSFGSRSSSGEFTPAPSSGSSCASCVSHNCAHCH